MAGEHKKFYRVQHAEIYLLDLNVQYKHNIKLPLDMVSKHVRLYLYLPDCIHTEFVSTNLYDTVLTLKSTSACKSMFLRHRSEEVRSDHISPMEKKKMRNYKLIS